MMMMRMMMMMSLSHATMMMGNMDRSFSSKGKISAPLPATQCLNDLLSSLTLMALV